MPDPVGLSTTGTCNICGVLFVYVRTRRYRIYCDIHTKQRTAWRPSPVKCACGKPFQPKRPGHLFCSKQCYEQGAAAPRVKRAARKARKMGAYDEPVDWLKVMRRDKWRCHMCHKKTLKRLRGTQDPLAPVVDHIVPLAAGGRENYDNVACACYECNAKKSAKILGQLSLFVAPANRTPLTVRDANRRKREKRDSRVCAAIEALTLMGQRPTLRAVAKTTGIKLDTLQAAARRERPEWATRLAPYEPPQAKPKLPKPPPPPSYCPRCHRGPLPLSGPGSRICLECRPTRPQREPKEVSCVGCGTIFTTVRAQKKFCSVRCQKKNEPSRLDGRPHYPPKFATIRSANQRTFRLE